MGNSGCGIFVDLPKAFKTIEHDIFLPKFKHYDIRGIANKCFKYYLFDRKKWVFINGHISNKASVKMAYHKDQFLGHFCSWYISMILIIL